MLVFVYFCIIVLLVKSIGALSFQRTSLKRGTAAELSQPLLHRLPDRKYPLREVPGFASSMIDSSIKLGVSERLQKVIARAGIASRRMAENMIMDGRVSVNGNLVTALGSKVNARKDKVAIDGKVIKIPEVGETFWVALNKPKSVITTMQDEGNRETVLDLVPKANELRLVPVGGMDRDFTGIMVLTNDVGWIHPLTHPSHPHVNKYEVVVNGVPSEADVEKLKKGVILEGDSRVSSLESVSVVDVDTRARMSILSVKVDERSTNQIERLLEFINCPVVGLKRTEYHGLKLKGLKKGKWRELSVPEIQALKDSCSKEPREVGVQSKETNSIVSSGSDRNCGGGGKRIPATATTKRRPSWAERRNELAPGRALLSRDKGVPAKSGYNTSKRFSP